MNAYLRLRLIVRPAGSGSAVSDGPLGLPGLTSLGALAPDRRPIPSPLIRRILGKALVDLFCPWAEPRCQPPRQAGQPAGCCSLAQTCPYGALFASATSARPPFAVYVLPNGGPGAQPNLELTLFGPNWRLYPWVLSGLQRALCTGLGKARAKWRIDQVLRVRPDRKLVRLCGSDLSRLESLEPDQIALTAGSRGTPQPIEVKLLSPTRLIHDGRLLRRGAPVPFRLLVARTLDRFSGLYGKGASDVLRPLIRTAIEADAARVPLLADRTRWIEVKDYSARSRAELKLGGRVGHLIYGEEATRFYPILRVGEILHLGKNPTSGCGRIQVDLSNAGRLVRHKSTVGRLQVA